MNKMKQVMDIVISAKGELTTEQKAQLKKLGLTEEQITQLKSMSQNGRPTPSDKNGNFNPPQGNMQGQIPGSMQGLQNNTASNSTKKSSSLITIAISFCASLAGLGFVIAFRRKRCQLNHI